MHIAIEGNAGAGKTTLAVALSQAIGCPVELEPSPSSISAQYSRVHDEPLTIQRMFTASRLASQRRISSLRTIGNVVSDFTLGKELTYAELWLEGEQLDDYAPLRQVVMMEDRSPDILLILEAPRPELLRRIGNRSRPDEAFVDADFLDHLDYLLQRHVVERYSCLKVFVDTTRTSFPYPCDDQLWTAIGPAIRRIAGS